MPDILVHHFVVERVHRTRIEVVLLEEGLHFLKFDRTPWSHHSCGLGNVPHRTSAKPIPSAESEAQIFHIVQNSARTTTQAPKLRHGVTSFQGLDLSVTHFSCSRSFATHPLLWLRFKCDALLIHNLWSSA